MTPARRAELPSPNSGPELLRDGIARKGETEGYAALEVFRVTRPAMSQWLNGRFTPNGYHQQIARDVYGVPEAAWDTEEEREKRLERLAQQPDAPVLPASEEPAPPTRRRRGRPVATRPMRKTGTD